MICVGDGAGLLCFLHVLSPDSIRLVNRKWDTLLLRSLRHELTPSELFHLHILQGSQSQGGYDRDNDLYTHDSSYDRDSTLYTNVSLVKPKPSIYIDKNSSGLV